MAQDRETDVLIVGAGASGAAVAWSLAGAGIRVVCLEQGPWIDPRTYPTSQDDWELHYGSDSSPDPNVRKLIADYPINDMDKDYMKKFVKYKRFTANKGFMDRVRKSKFSYLVNPQFYQLLVYVFSQSLIFVSLLPLFHHHSLFHK